MPFFGKARSGRLSIRLVGMDEMPCGWRTVSGMSYSVMRGGICSGFFSSSCSTAPPCLLLRLFAAAADDDELRADRVLVPSKDVAGAGSMSGSDGVLDDGVVVESAACIACVLLPVLCCCGCCCTLPLPLRVVMFAIVFVLIELSTGTAAAAATTEERLPCRRVCTPVSFTAVLSCLLLLLFTSAPPSRSWAVPVPSCSCSIL